MILLRNIDASIRIFNIEKSILFHYDLGPSVGSPGQHVSFGFLQRVYVVFLV